MTVTKRIWRWQVNEYRAKGYQFQFYTNFLGWLRPVAVLHVAGQPPQHS